MRLGALLLEKNLISSTELDTALQYQTAHGGRLGESLIALGYINYYDLYHTLATQQHLPFVDLVRTPPDRSLISVDDYTHYTRLSVLPYAWDAGVMVLATTTVSEATIAWAQQRYGPLFRFVITSPFDIRHAIEICFAARLHHYACEFLHHNQPHFSAKALFRSALQGGTVCFAALLLAVTFPLELIVPLFWLLQGVYALPLMFKLVLLLRGAFYRYPSQDVPSGSFPTYSILVPLYQESRLTIAALSQALLALDYPRHLLDIKLIVEADDDLTIRTITSLALPYCFEMIQVPYSEPRTKPKACNYAIRFARGTFVTIYDAEDRPEPDQLRKAVLRFSAQPDLVCLQARLNYYNRYENWLTGFFALEYGMWFRFLLPGLLAFGMPIPLGGTSNHFRIASLRQLGYWDPYNVTEDADLGIRLLWYQGAIGLLDSTTWEEAPIYLRHWFKQRSRWIKGYIQTYFVHMRRPYALWQRCGMRGFIGVQLFIGAPALLYLLSPFAWLMVGALWLLSYHPDAHWLWWVAYSNFWFGVLIHWLSGSCAVFGWRFYRLLWLVPLFPLYWMLHSCASFHALYQLIYRPYYWEKTPHGLSRSCVPSDRL